MNTVEEIFNEIDKSLCVKIVTNDNKTYTGPVKRNDFPEGISIRDCGNFH